MARPATPVLVGLIIAALFLQFPYALQMPFLNEDYIFLDQTARQPFPSFWDSSGLAFHRPWSRDLHYWVLQRVFGAWAPGFHAVSLLLCAAVITLYLTWVRRMSDGFTAVVAATGVAVMAAWAAPVLWVAGVQDLWMLLFALSSLHLIARGRMGLSAAALALALLSKETAMAVPIIAWFQMRLIEKRSIAASFRATAWHWIVLGGWAALHPMLGGRLWGAEEAGSSASRVFGSTSQPWMNAVRSSLSMVNLDRMPAPEGAGFVAVALPAAVIVALLVLWAHRARGRQPKMDWPTRRTIVSFGIVAAAAGWVPLLWPGLAWQSYYGLLGALGAWLAVSTALAHRPRIALIVLLACSFLRSAQGVTPSLEWGSEAYQRRAGTFLRSMRADLQRKHPSFPPHARLYFTGVPSSVGFITKGAPALRVWYGDSTLSGGLYRAYRSRGPTRAAGPDYFFRYDTTSGWVQIHAGDEDLAAARRTNPRWEQDHLELSAAMARAEDWAGVGLQYEKLARAFPDSAEYALNAAMGFEMNGDSIRAVTWYRRMVDTPGAASDDVRFARDFEARWAEAAAARRRGAESPP